MAGIQPFQPSSDRPWNKQKVIHLYRRLGFGPTPSQIDNAVTMDPQVLIGNIFDGIKSRALPTAPSWANFTAQDYENTDNLKFDHRQEHYYSYLTDMIDDGLRSKIVLFWHNHFVTELNIYDCNKYLWNYYRRRLFLF